MSKGVQIALAAATVFAGVVIVLTLGASGEGTFRYYADLAQFSNAPASELARAVRVHGFVAPGSIQKDLAAGHVDFTVEDKAKEHKLAVRYLGIDVPDMFKDGAEVVVEGRYETGTFMAERVMAKCPSKYEAKAGAGS
ncbi:MAG TPA: cytochrome c maturation protein CcmE [Myxococcota bacterium]|nr:cytochrome c maturation protein CcmE [Myxococcota bacterium]